MPRLRPGVPRWSLLGAHWYRANHPLAYWDVFDHPKPLPRYQMENYSSSVGERTLWWYAADKAAKLDQAK